MDRRDFFPGSLKAPQWTETLLHKYGQNRYSENILRVAFLPSRAKIVGGYWEEEGELEYKLVPKYGRKEKKWALERFVPSAWLGTPESWDLLSSTLEGYYGVGPFPEHGVYECCAVFSTGFGPQGYVPLEPGMIDLQARAIWMGRMQTSYQIRAAAMGEEEEKLRRADENFEKFLRDRSFSRDSSFGMAAVYNRENAIDDYKLKILKSKAWKKKHRFVKGFSQGEVN